MYVFVFSLCIDYISKARKLKMEKSLRNTSEKSNVNEV